MVLTQKQEEGLRTAVARYNAHEPWTCIAGYAGTGKSTLVKFIISALGLYDDQVAYIAYTGKASLVLREKGCPNAQTAHKLLYNSFPRRDGTFYHMPKRPLDKNYKLIILDEVSMFPKEMWELLLTHNVHVIALGDPFQLPPIGEDNGVLKNPHVFLDEIMRQAQESEIIRLTMDIRAGKPLALFKGKEVQVIDKSELVDGMYTWADQIIVGKNATRHQVNFQMRRMLHGVEDNTPVDGDKIVCLRNDWNTITPNGDVLVNGVIGYLKNPHVEQNIPYIGKRLMGDFLLEEYVDTIEYSHYAFQGLPMDYKLFENHEFSINQDNFRKVPKIWHPKQFDYGYCITCHKSQGSEYNKVLVLEEYLGGGEHERWLYTAATRAKEKLVIVRDYR